MSANVRARVFAIGTTVAVMALVGCNGSSGSSGSSAEGSTARAAVPRPLNVIEAAAEDVIDQIPRGRWTRIEAGVAQLQAAWRRYQQDARATDGRQAQRLDAALAVLSTQAADEDGLGVEQAANDVSAAAVELLAHYALGHPVQIGRLDVIGRQIIIEVERADLTAASAPADRARREWQAVRRSVRRHHGSRVVARTEATLRRLDAGIRAGDGRAITNESRDLLELVDAMERLYRRL